MATNNSTNDGTRTLHGIFIGQDSAAPVFTVLADGELLVGSTGADPVATSITGGTGITVTPGAGTLTISSSGSGGFIWNDITGTTQTVVSGNGYVSNNVSLVTFTLPAIAAFGDSFAIAGLNLGGWLVGQAAGQTIHLGNATTTLTTGTLASTNQYDSLFITCIVANTTFTAYAVTGNITVV